MAEAIHCPSCSTRYRLRPERLQAAIRRAKCFSCGGVFPVGDIVQRLLALPDQQATAGFKVEDLDAIQHAPFSQLEANDPSLTLGDLEAADSEILEKTLIEAPAFLPEAKPDAAPMHMEAAAPTHAPTPDEPEPTLSGYTSARDAIDKLFGDAPAAPGGLKMNPNADDMDMEATLSALETTLGGTAPMPHPATITHGDSPTASGLTEEDLAGSSTATVRISQADLLAAMAATPSATEEPTVALRASDLMTVAPDERTAVMAPQGPSTARSFAPETENPDSGAELLRLKIGEEIYGGLTMPQLIAWVSEGRILENHLISRQHSENWLDAHKVPGLRPVFERLRRERSGGAPTLDSGTGEIAPKKSLFGGLFGKG